MREVGAMMCTAGSGSIDHWASAAHTPHFTPGVLPDHTRIIKDETRSRRGTAWHQHRLSNNLSERHVSPRLSCVQRLALLAST